MQTNKQTNKINSRTNTITSYHRQNTHIKHNCNQATTKKKHILKQTKTTMAHRHLYTQKKNCKQKKMKNEKK